MFGSLVMVLTEAVFCTVESQAWLELTLNFNVNDLL